jgi:hypothetical protein
MPPRIETMPPTLLLAVVWPAKIHTPPPSPVLPAPTVTRMEPALPFVDAPLPIETLPLFPSLVVPELKLSHPETPLVPELCVLMVIEPLDVEHPMPLESAMEPPEYVSPLPLRIITVPPLP